MSSQGPSSSSTRPQYPFRSHLTLRPFPGSDTPEATLTATLDLRSPDDVRVKFVLKSDSAKFVIPELVHSRPSRLDNLWQNLCFEVFFRVKGRRDYWEMNVAPRGDWNVYSFSDYREGMKPESLVDSLSDHAFDGTDRHWTVQFRLPLELLKIKVEEIELSLTAVLVELSGRTSYWATKHAGKQPDFHHSESLERFVR